ncbi:pimeloyl-ACP methyl ester esterase BioH [Ectothiorhodospiraceae bacterium 2226]|nr:pimeloyl-ACP methyl ester esterase BioH [Ectothiorhodospiraceae bacterium 2226]
MPRPEPLVLLHGWGMHPGFLAPLGATLPERAVAALALPGHGPRAAEPVQDGAGAALLSNWAQDAAAQAPRGADWLGWSLGGMVALAVAAAAPDAVRRLVLVASNPRFVSADDWPHAVAPAVLEAFAAELAQDHRATLLRFLALQARGARADVRDLRVALDAAPTPAPGALRAGLSILRGADLRGLLPRVRQPVLLIGGERDTLAPPAALEAVAAALPDARLRLLRGAGHAPFVSNPEQVSAWIREFLDE